MVEARPSGVMVPEAEGGEPISIAGVQELRATGAIASTTVDAGRTGRVLLAADIAAGLDDVFTLPADEYTIPNAVSAALLANLPERTPGILVKHVTSGSPVAAVRFMPHRRDYAWETQTRSTTGDWMAWRKVGGDRLEPEGAAPGAVTDLGHAHAVRRAVFRRRRGGAIGTGGRPAIALRWDHGLVSFRDKVLPDLVRLGLPGAMAMNSADNRWRLSESAGVTPADLARWATDHGIEVWNHSQTHGAAETLDALTREIATGLTDLQAKIPTVPIEGFVIPGVPSGNYAGFSAGQDISRWDTMAGRLILGHHAVSSSHMPGTAGPLGGDQPILGRQLSIDRMSLSSVRAEIDDLIATGQGSLILFLHPSQLDEPGRIASAEYTAVLEHVASKREAGDVEVLTMGGLSVADQGRPARPAYAPLLNAMRIPQRLRPGGAVTRVRSFTSRPLWARGAPREIIVDLDVTAAGTVSLSTADATAVTWTVGTGAQTLRRPIIIPMRATGLSVSVTSGTAIATVTQVADYPI